MGTLFKYLLRILLLLLVVAFAFSFAFNRWIKKDATGDAESLAPSGIFEQVDGVKYHLVKRGIGSETFLLLHDYGSSAYTWAKEMDELSNIGRVIAVDFPGYGYSDHSSSIDYRTEAEVQRISDLLKAEGVSKAIIVAHGYGAKIALALAQDHSDQIQKMILISPAVYHDTKPLSGFMLSIPEINKALVKIAYSRSRLQQQYVKNFTNPSQITTDQIDTYIQPYQLKGIEKSIIARATQKDKVKYDVTKITQILTLIIWGEQDKTIPRADIEHLRADLASEPKVVTLPNVGHLPQEESPNEVLNELKAFIQLN